MHSSLYVPKEQHPLQLIFKSLRVDFLSPILADLEKKEELPPANKEVLSEIGAFVIFPQKNSSRVEKTGFYF